MKKILASLLTLCIVLTLFATPVSASAASDSSNLDNVLKYYKKNDIKKANAYNKKLPYYANESCVKKMSSKMKKEYKKALKGYRLYDRRYSRKCLDGLYFSDIDNDKKAEMILTYGSCNANRVMIIYKYVNGRAKKVAQERIGWLKNFIGYPGHKGILAVGICKGYQQVRRLTVSGKHIKDTTLISRSVPNNAKEFPFRYKLKKYLKYNKKTHKDYIDYSVLK